MRVYECVDNISHVCGYGILIVTFVRRVIIAAMSEAITVVDNAIFAASWGSTRCLYPTVIWAIGRTRAGIDSDLQTQFPVIMIIINQAKHSLPHSLISSDFLKRGIEQTRLVRGSHQILWESPFIKVPVWKGEKIKVWTSPAVLLGVSEYLGLSPHICGLLWARPLMWYWNMISCNMRVEKLHLLKRKSAQK